MPAKNRGSRRSNDVGKGVESSTVLAGDRNVFAGDGGSVVHAETAHFYFLVHEDHMLNKHGDPSGTPSLPAATKYTFEDNNPVPGCAELLSGSKQGSTIENFDLFPELRFGTERLEYAETTFAEVGLSRATLILNMDSCCILPGIRLGDTPSDKNVISGGGNTWTIVGPSEDGLLHRMSLGDVPLCRLAINATQARVEISILVDQKNISYNMLDERAANATKEQMSIIKIFINKCLGQREGRIEVCRSKIYFTGDTNED